MTTSPGELTRNDLLRVSALELATKYAEGVGPAGSEDVVTAAKDFYEFLKGDAG